MSCATCVHCESRAHPPLYVPVRWCVLMDEPAIFPCMEWARAVGSDDE